VAVTAWDPRTERESAPFRLQFERQATREQFLPNSVGQAAMLSLNRVVSLWFAGFGDEVRPIVERICAWLEDSIARAETFGRPPSYFAALRTRDLAIGRWLCDKGEQRELFAEAASLAERSWGDLDADDEQLTAQYLPDWARDCVDAGACAHAIAVASRLGAPQPARADDVRDELALALWACAHPDDAGGVARAGAGVLTGRIEQWLADGSSVRAAAWLKLAFWNTGETATADETLRRAYELMPGVEPPPDTGDGAP
jgi:hypothetical protein